MRSFECARTFVSWESCLTTPEKTRNRLMRPANGSASVLNTYAIGSPSSSGSISTSLPSPSRAVTAPFLAGDGRSCTSASSSRSVPRFLVAMPQVTGKIVPAVTPSLSAETISSCEISSPSR